MGTTGRRRHGSRRRWWGLGGRRPGHRPPAWRLLDAATAAWEVEPELFGEVVAVLHEADDDGEPVLALIDARLTDAVDGAWRRGWTPAEVAHVVGRRLATTHVAIVARAVGLHAAAHPASAVEIHPRWQAQLDELEAHAARRVVPVDAAVAVLALVDRLAPIPPSLPRPGDRAPLDTTGLDEKVLARVRALLAKAGSTTFDEEAEALSAKAQELITRHAIGAGLLRDPDEVGAPGLRRINLVPPYERAKAALVGEIASANHCRAVHRDDHGWVTVFGYGAELDAVEVLSASLLAQATGAMARHGRRADAAGRSTTRSFRRAFLLGFATRIGDRLREAVAGEVAAAGAAGDGLLPVLAARDDRLERAIAEAFPNVVRRSANATNASGWSAGRVAADLADLSVASGRLRR